MFGRDRTFRPPHHRPDGDLDRLVHIDYGRAMAFVAIEEKMVGVVRLHAESNRESREFAITVPSDFKGHGLGWMLMQLIIEYARESRAAGRRRTNTARKSSNSIITKGDVMPVVDAVIVAAIVAAFVIFAGVLAWAEQQTRDLPPRSR